MTTNNKISNLVSSQVPFYVRNDHQNFVRFLESYYEYMEQSGKAVSVQKNIRSFQDIDRTEQQFADKLYQEYMKLMPAQMQADKALVMKYVRDFYVSRGSEKSIKFLLNILFNRSDVEFYYPKKDILRASDGKWFIQRTLRVTDVIAANVSNSSLYALEKFVNKSIYGANSGATAIGERVDQFYDNGTLISEISISGITGTFENGEQLYAYYDGVPFANGSSVVIPTYLITGNVFGGILNTITVTNPGTGYSIGDPVVIESNTGTGAVAVVSKVSTGNVTSVTVLEGGAGYRANDYLIITGGGGTGANGEVTIVLKDGSVHPNSYNIYFDTISLEANTSFANATSNGIYESFAYQNLRVQYTRTSNLFANTFTSLSAINLTHWTANSNAYFETFDSLNLTNQVSGVSNTVLITSSNIRSNLVYISPAFATPQNNLRIQVIKKANANTTFANGINSYSFSNVGPATVIRINSPGTGYTSVPTIAIQGNTSISELGILGRMKINNGGSGYVAGDKIEFINVVGGYGSGALGNVRTVNATGSITNVEFIAVTGHPVGGTGYDQNYLPTANIVSGTGTSANVTVTNILGTGGSFIVANSVLGAIEDISIVNRGTGYTRVPTINLSQSGDGTATANATIIEGVFEYPGRWLNDDGHLSSHNFLEDRDYYQPYSYVIRVSESVAKYRKALKELTHPAGMKLFGEHITIDNLDDYTNRLSALDDQIVITSTRIYDLQAGNTSVSSPSYGVYTTINYSSHSVSVGNVVNLQFISGNVADYANIYSNKNYQPNGNFVVLSVINADTFLVNSGKNKLPASRSLYSLVGGAFNESSMQEIYIRKSGQNTDGIIYLIGTSRDYIYEYTMNVAGDISTLNYNRRSNLDLSIGVDDFVRGFDFSGDGKHIYFVGGLSGNTQRRIVQCSMSEDWNIQTTYITSNTFNLVPSFGINPFQVAIRMHPSGNNAYLMDNLNRTLYQYSLSENWNIASINTSTLKEKSVSIFDTAIVGFDFNYTGNVIYMTGSTTDRITSLRLDQAWNVNSANFQVTTNSVNFTTLSTTPSGIAVSNDETMIYITSTSGSPTTYALHQFPLIEKGNANSAIILLSSPGNVRIRKTI